MLNSKVTCFLSKKLTHKISLPRRKPSGTRNEMRTLSGFKENSVWHVILRGIISYWNRKFFYKRIWTAFQINKYIHLDQLML